jgi:hypothetical protein
MGITATLTRYRRDALAEARRNKSFYPPNGDGLGVCYLDRSWDELHPALMKLGLPLSLTLSGDYGFEGGLTAFGWDKSNENDHYLAFVSPQLVKKIAKALRDLPFEVLLPKPIRGSDYLSRLYRSLVQFYTAAATGGDCVFICVA